MIAFNYLNLCVFCGSGKISDIFKEVKFLCFHLLITTLGQLVIYYDITGLKALFSENYLNIYEFPS